MYMGNDNRKYAIKTYIYIYYRKQNRKQTEFI